MRRLFAAIDTVLSRAVSLMVSVVLLLMVTLAFLQVILRNLFDSGIPWADIVLRHLVLWVCMLGGMLATRQGRQISIDLLTRTSKPVIRKILAWAGSIFSLIVVAVLANASWVFVKGEKDFGATLYGDVPSWYILTILPAGFTLIALQVLLNLALGRSGVGLPAVAEVAGEGRDPGSRTGRGSVTVSDESDKSEPQGEPGTASESDRTKKYPRDDNTTVTEDPDGGTGAP